MADQIELTGWDVSCRNITGAAEEGDRVELTFEKDGSRGFSDKTIEKGGIIAEMTDRSMTLEDGDEITQSGVVVQYTHYFDGKQYTHADPARVVITKE